MNKIIVYILIIIPIYTAPALAYTDNQIADAIYKAEASKAHPYGIMQHYKTTTARQACINSIISAKARWAKAGSPGDFIAFMGLRYSPPAINPNWVRLVHWFLDQAQITASKHINRPGIGGPRPI